jgi:hypothetical protein
MKKLLTAVALVILLSTPAFAVQWVTANQASVEWVAVTTLDNGDPFPATDILEYTVYIANATTDPNKDNPAEVGTTQDVTYAITLNVEGQFYVGVEAIRKLADDTVVNTSPISWSDDPTKVATEPFGIRYYLAPTGPIGLAPVIG